MVNVCSCGADGSTRDNNKKRYFQFVVIKLMSTKRHRLLFIQPIRKLKTMDVGHCHVMQTGTHSFAQRVGIHRKEIEFEATILLISLSNNSDELRGTRLNMKINFPFSSVVEPMQNGQSPYRIHLNQFMLSSSDSIVAVTAGAAFDERYGR